MPVVLALAVLQSTLFVRLRLGGVVPNLVLVTVVSWSLLRGAREGFVWAFAGGLALDLLSAGPLGLSAVALLIVCALAGLTEGHVQAQSFSLALASVVLGSLAFDAIVWAGVALAGHPPGALGDLLATALTAALVNAAMTLPVHWILRRLYLAAERSEVRLGS